MPLNDSPSLDRFSIIAPTPALGQFILGQSLIGGTDTIGGTMVDRNILVDAIESVETDRGVEPSFINPKPRVGTMTLTVKNPQDPVRIGQRIKLVYTNSDAPAGETIFTGRVSDVDTDADPTGKNRIVRITALDRIAEISQVPRHGAVVEDFKLVERTTPRMQRLLAATASAQVFGPADTPLPLTNRPLAPSLILTEFWEIPEEIYWGATSTAVTFEFVNGLAVSTTLTGLVPGAYYQLRMNFTYVEREVTWAIDGQWVPENAWPGFIAKAETAILQVTGDGVVSFSNGILYSLTAPTEVHTTTVHTTNLANHLDQIVAGTETWGWWATRDGAILASANARVISVTAPHGYMMLSLGIPGPLGVDMQAMNPLRRTETSADVINTLEVETHQVHWDEDGVMLADDRTEGPYIDDTSVASYGPRDHKLETQIGDVMWAARLADRLMARTALPKERVREINVSGQQINTQGVSGLAAGIARLEPFDGVVDMVSATPGWSLVASVRHVITASRWTCQLTLLPDAIAP